MRSTNIADLRNRLTQYLREVREGEEIIVCDRKRPIAKIVPLDQGDDAERSDLVAAGLLRPAEHDLPPSFWKTRRPRLGLRSAVAAVSADRDEG